MKGDKNVSREEAQGLAARSEIRRQALMKKGLREVLIIGIVSDGIDVTKARNPELGSGGDMSRDNE